MSDLKLLTVEAMANTEVNKDGRGTLKPMPCTISTDYIVGHDSNGDPIIERRNELGEEGICEPYGNNSCVPYECTKRL